MREPQFAVTGSGRSGTAYIAALLTACGIRCGHERWWGMTNDIRTQQFDGDASWMATFDRGYPGVRLAQVRDPRTAVPSIASWELRPGPWLVLRSQIVALTGRRDLDAIRVWTTYTREAVERAAFWWRVEDVNDAVVQRIADTVHLPVRNIPAALAVTPPKNGRSKDPFAWPDHPDAHEALELGRQLGYA